MVYIRNKKVKGIDYAYLVQSAWDPKRNMSRQKTVKYLGKASQITIEDIPEEYRNDTKILAFVSAFSSYQEERKILASRIQEEMFALLTDCNVNGLVDLYEKYSRLFGLTEFYDKTSVPTDYVIDYIRDLEPDIIFISITLVENIKAAERLVQEIHAKYNNKLPVMVGGSAFNKIEQDSTIKAFLMKNASFDDIMKLVKMSIV